MRHRATPTSCADRPLRGFLPHPPALRHVLLALLIGLFLVLLPRLVRGQSNGYGSYGSQGGGIIYYGNGAVVTSPPPATIAPASPPSDSDGDNVVPGSAGYPPCPATGTVFPNPPPPCAPTDGTIIVFPSPVIPMTSDLPDGYGYGYGGGYNDGYGPPPQRAIPRRPPPRPLPRPIVRPDHGE